LKDLTIKKIK